MEKELQENIKKRVKDFEEKYKLKLNLAFPVSVKEPVFGIEGEKKQLEMYWNELLFWFNDLHFFHMYAFHFSHNGSAPKNMMHIYGYKMEK